MGWTMPEDKERYFFGLDTGTGRSIERSRSAMLRMTQAKQDRIIWTGYWDHRGPPIYFKEQKRG